MVSKISLDNTPFHEPSLGRLLDHGLFSPDCDLLQCSTGEYAFVEGVW